MPRRTRQADGDVFVVTDAGRSRAEDLRDRQRKYILKMLFRTTCLIAAIVLYAVGVPLPWLIGLIVISTVLPWMSVVVANAEPEQQPRRRPQSFDTAARRTPLPPPRDGE